MKVHVLRVRRQTVRRRWLTHEYFSKVVLRVVEERRCVLCPCLHAAVALLQDRLIKETDLGPIRLEASLLQEALEHLALQQSREEAMTVVGEVVRRLQESGFVKKPRHFVALRDFGLFCGTHESRVLAERRHKESQERCADSLGAESVTAGLAGILVSIGVKDVRARPARPFKEPRLLLPLRIGLIGVRGAHPLIVRPIDDGHDAVVRKRRIRPEVVVVIILHFVDGTTDYRSPPRPLLRCPAGRRLREMLPAPPFNQAVGRAGVLSKRFLQLASFLRRQRGRAAGRPRLLIEAQVHLVPVQVDHDDALGPPPLRRLIEELAMAAKQERHGRFQHVDHRLGNHRDEGPLPVKGEEERQQGLRHGGQDAHVSAEDGDPVLQQQASEDGQRIFQAQACEQRAVAEVRHRQSILRRPRNEQRAVWKRILHSDLSLRRQGRLRHEARDVSLNRKRRSTQANAVELCEELLKNAVERIVRQQNERLRHEHDVDVVL
mmetsp:Transcript_2113/g.9261  ORF Transcript_2113/g.9261 Transcript_2113/m.9261 type:complete len:491 (+) Transcript_2113:1856-3328(+)